MNELAAESEERSPSFFARAGHGLRAAFRFTLDVALPPLCPSCREPLGDGVGLCAACWSKLSLIEPPYCARLGIPFVYDPGPGLLSMEAIANPPAYQRARAAVRYDEVAKTLVHGFKYSDRLDLAPMMGGWMARAGRELLAGADGLVPVPLHWRRLWSRRFNQSASLAGVISTLAGVPVLHGALKRVRATRQQVGLSQAQRAENVQGAFRVGPEGKAAVAGRRVILIDDVLTSGATVDTCGRAPPGSMCWSSPGLWRRPGAPYKLLAGNAEFDSMPPVEIYTTRYCPYCTRAKALLKRKGVDFKEIDLAGNWELRDEMIQRANGRTTVPQIFIGNMHVGGCDDLHELDYDGKLDPLLKGEGLGAGQGEGQPA